MKPIEYESDSKKLTSTCKIENFLIGEITKERFKNQQPRTGMYNIGNRKTIELNRHDIGIVITLITLQVKSLISNIQRFITLPFV